MEVHDILPRLFKKSNKSEQQDACIVSSLSFAPRAPQILVEALTGDFSGVLDHVSLVAKSGLDVYAHNIETVEELTPFVRDRRATFRQSLKVLEHAKKEGVKVTKSSIMLGVGETHDQVLDALKGALAIFWKAFVFTRSPELRKSDVDVVTFGQYMRPTRRHMKVDRYVEPSEFERWKTIADDMGFLYVASGPLVRSSYKVWRLLIDLLELTCTLGWGILHREHAERQSCEGYATTNAHQPRDYNRYQVVYFIIDFDPRPPHWEWDAARSLRHRPIL